MAGYVRNNAVTGVFEGSLTLYTISGLNASDRDTSVFPVFGTACLSQVFGLSHMYAFVFRQRLGITKSALAVCRIEHERSNNENSKCKEGHAKD